MDMFKQKWSIQHFPIKFPISVMLKSTEIYHRAVSDCSFLFVIFVLFYIISIVKFNWKPVYCIIYENEQITFLALKWLNLLIFS